jgi:uncharacterized iron-regulated membrane protein
MMLTDQDDRRFVTLGNNRLRRWSWIHKWSSLVCTVFMLLLCLTGLPLIFHEEIDEWLHVQVEAAAVAPGTRPADIDRVITNGMAKAPGEVLHFLVWDQHDPNTILLSVGRSIDANPEGNRLIRVDAHTGEFLDAPDVTRRFTYIMLKLHTDMFAGLPGKLFLGLMGILFCVAIVSGIVVYAPSMQKLEFGAVRRERLRAIRWLDIHNLVGIVLVIWTLVVGLTGVLNTWADLVIKIWQFGQLADMTAAYRDRPIPTKFAQVQAAVDTARNGDPEGRPAFVAFPGTILSSKSHYAVFLRGDSPLTARMLKPVLIDAETGAFTDSRALPWYVSTLLLSQPLHFGDYGGLPLKIVWALLDVATIAVLMTGLYLWLGRRRPRPATQADTAAAVASQR